MYGVPVVILYVLFGTAVWYIMLCMFTVYYHHHLEWMMRSLFFHTTPRGREDVCCSCLFVCSRKCASGRCVERIPSDNGTLGEGLMSRKTKKTNKRPLPCGETKAFHANNGPNDWPTTYSIESTSHHYRYTTTTSCSIAVVVVVHHINKKKKNNNNKLESISSDYCLLDSLERQL